ncbi:MAG: transglycosylase SLT domain-containing protein [Bacteroidia bacterium]|nr:transglycosylase SLT domain-containing protein [Bacteroidia bacterium]
MRFVIWGVSWALLLRGQSWDARIREMDSLVKSYIAWQREGGETPPIKSDLLPLDPQVFEERLHALNATIPLEANPASLQQVYLYIYQQSTLTAYLLGLADYYLPIIEPILRSYGLPSELQYLPIIESAFVPEALSPMAAAGIWQFIPGTGRIYGLRVDRIIDERYDVVKSTHAAARYLRDSYQILGDWLLVIASYNCGVGRVLRAIKMSGGKTNYWEIAPYLPLETRGYVPAFIAACYIMNYAQAHGIQPIFPDIPRETDTVTCPIRMKLSLIASASKVPLSWLKFYNAELRADIVPAGYVLRVPAIAAYEISEAIGRLSRGELALQPVSQRYSGYKQLIWHTVRPGENLYTIARTYQVSPYHIVRTNQLWGYKVAPGMRLRIVPQADSVESLEEWGAYIEGGVAWKRQYIPVFPYIIPRFVPFKLPVKVSPDTIPMPELPEGGPSSATHRRRRF